MALPANVSFEPEYPSGHGSVMRGDPVVAMEETGVPSMPFPSSEDLASIGAVPYTGFDNRNVYNVHGDQYSSVTAMVHAARDPERDPTLDFARNCIVFGRQSPLMRDCMQLKSVSALNAELRLRGLHGKHETAEEILAKWKLLGAVTVSNPVGTFAAACNQYVPTNIVFSHRARIFNYWHHLEDPDTNCDRACMFLWFLLVRRTDSIAEADTYESDKTRQVDANMRRVPWPWPRRQERDESSRKAAPAVAAAVAASEAAGDDDLDGWSDDDDESRAGAVLEVKEHHYEPGSYWTFVPYATLQRGEPPTHLYINPEKKWVGEALYFGTSHWIHSNGTTISKRAMRAFVLPTRPGQWLGFVDSVPQIDAFIAI